MSNKLFRQFHYFLIILLFGCFYAYAQITAKVIRINDGDTIVVLHPDKTEKTLRLAEVDCPESDQPFGNAAKYFTSHQVLNKEVDYWTTDTDRYGRTIAKVFYDDGKYLSAEIISNGYGWWYYWYSTDTRLKELETEAKNDERGLWVESKPVAPWEWRKTLK